MKRILLAAIVIAGCDRNDVSDIASSAPKVVDAGIDLIQQQADAVAPALKSLKQEQLDTLYKVEYLVRDFDSNLSASQTEQLMNQLGNDGWECVSTIKNENTTTRFTFKRRARSYLPLLLRFIN